MKKSGIIFFAAVVLLFSLGSCSDMFLKEAVAPAPDGNIIPAGKLEIHFSTPGAKTLLPSVRFDSIELNMTWHGYPDSSGTDVTALQAALQAVYAARAGVTVNTNAANVARRSYYVSQAEWEALDSLVKEAEPLFTDLKFAVQNNVDTMVSGLNAALATFNLAKKEGTKNVRQSLIDKLKDADNFRAGYANASGAASTVAQTVEFYSTTNWNTFNTAINTAAAVLRNINATQSQIDGAVTTLQGAINTFANITPTMGTGNNGTGNNAINRSTLKTKLTEAYMVRGGIAHPASSSESISAATVPEGVQWVNWTNWNNFAVSTSSSGSGSSTRHPIPYAETQYKTLYSSGNFTQTTLNNSVTYLNNAITNFTASGNITNGSYIPAGKAALITAIQNAYMAKLGVLRGIPGDTNLGLKCATQVQFDALETAIQKAETAACGDTQQDMADATSALNTARTTFTGQILTGTKPIADPDPEDMNRTLSIPGNATSYIADIPALGIWEIMATGIVNSKSVVWGKKDITINGSSARVSISLTNLDAGNHTEGYLNYSFTNLEELSRNGLVYIIAGPLDDGGLPMADYSWIVTHPGGEMWERLNPSLNYFDICIGTVECLPGYYGIRVWYVKTGSAYPQLLYDEVFHIYPGLTTFARADIRAILQGGNNGGGFTFNGPGDETITWSATMGDPITITVTGFDEYKWFVDSRDVTNISAWVTEGGQKFSAAKSALGLAPGSHHITVLVRQGTAWYSKRVNFSIAY